MSILLNCWDPFGSNVLLYEDRFDNHIAGRHEEIETLELVRQAIEDPDFVTQDRRNRIIYLYGHRPTSRPPAPSDAHHS